jgi:hypothetical protein
MKAKEFFAAINIHRGFWGATAESTVLEVLVLCQSQCVVVLCVMTVPTYMYLFLRLAECPHRAAAVERRHRDIRDGQRPGAGEVLPEYGVFR